MGKRNKTTLQDRLRQLFKAKDEEGFEKALTNVEPVDDEGDDDEGGDTHVHVHLNGAVPAELAKPADPGNDEDPTEARFGKIEDALGSLAEAVSKMNGSAEDRRVKDEGDNPDKDADKDKVDDEEPEGAEVERSTAMDAVAKAEILAPGISLPSFTGAKAKAREVTILRRTALDKAYGVAATKAVLDKLTAGVGVDFAKMKPSHVRTVFDAAAVLVADANNAKARAAGTTIPQGPMTAAKYQEHLRERRKERYGAR